MSEGNSDVELTKSNHRHIEASGKVGLLEGRERGERGAPTFTKEAIPTPRKKSFIGRGGNHVVDCPLE